MKGGKGKESGEGHDTKDLVLREQCWIKSWFLCSCFFFPLIDFLLLLSLPLYIGLVCSNVLVFYSLPISLCSRFSFMFSSSHRLLMLRFLRCTDPFECSCVFFFDTPISMFFSSYTLFFPANSFVSMFYPFTDLLCSYVMSLPFTDLIAQTPYVPIFPFLSPSQT